MLYNEQWNKRLSLDGLITWLEQQPPDRVYDYNHASSGVFQTGCLLYQYLDDIGYPVTKVYSECVDTRTSSVPLPRGMNTVAAMKPWTFGAALERAKEYQNAV